MAEVDDAQLAEMRNVAALMDKVWAHPEARELMQRAIKAQNPQRAIPEMDAKEAVLAEVRKERDARLALEQRLEKQQQDAEENRLRGEFAASWERQKDALRAAGYMDEGVAKIEDHAKKFGIPSLEVAAAHWEKLNPPAAPVTPSGTSWNFFDIPEDDTSKRYIDELFKSGGENEAAVDREIANALKDSRSQARR